MSPQPLPTQRRQLKPLTVLLALVVCGVLAWAMMGLLRKDPPASPAAAGHGSAAASAVPVVGPGGVPLSPAGRPVAPPQLGFTGVGSATTPTPEAATTMAPGPTLTRPATPVGPVEAWATESRDDAWATAAEKALRDRVAELKLPAVEAAAACKATTCQLTLRKLTPEVLADLPAKLESEQGLAGVAKAIVLGAVTPEDDGTSSWIVTVAF